MRPISEVSEGADREGDPDRTWVLLFLALLLASVVAAAVMAFALDVSTYASVTVLTAPLIVTGALALLLSRRMLWLLVPAVVSVVLYLLGPAWTVAALAIGFGSYGVATVSGSLQRCLFYEVLGAVECGSVSPKPRPMERLALFVIGIPRGVDARDIRISDGIRRSDLPYRDVALTALLAAVPCLVVCIYTTMVPAFRYEVSWIACSLLTVAMYCTLAALPWTVLRSLDVHIPGGMRLYDGPVSSASRAVPMLAVVLAISMIALHAGAVTAGYVVLAVVLLAVSAVSASVPYYLYVEEGVVSSLLACWSDHRPVDPMAGLGSGEPHPLDDGVPGTPSRYGRRNHM